MDRKVSNYERAVLRSALSKTGYVPVDGGKRPADMNGREALAACKSSGVNIPAVLMDAKSQAIWQGNEEKSEALQAAYDAEISMGDAGLEAQLNAAFEAAYDADAKVKPAPKKARSRADLLLELLENGDDGLTLEDVQKVASRIAKQEVTEALEAFAQNNAVVHRFEVKAFDGEVKAWEGLAHEKQDLLNRVSHTRDAHGNLKNIALTGPRGSGKSQAARIVAKVMDVDFYAHGMMTYEHQVMGSVHPLNDMYRETQFIKCYREGGVVLLDEMDRWDPQATTALNGALSDREIWLENGECIKRHPDCLIICAMNTKGTGPDADYVGANKLDAAFLDRFATMIEWNVDEKLEQELVGNSEVLLNVRKARAQVARYGIDMEITPRMAIDMADHVRAGLTVEDAAAITYMARMSDEQKELIAQ